jgi:hypothetical protein
LDICAHCCFSSYQENTADIDEAATDSNRGERRQSRKRRCPKNGASEHADATMRPTSAAAAFDAANTGDKVAPSAAQAEGKRCSDDFSGEMAVSIQSSIEPTPDHGCDRRRDATSRRLQLDSEEGATKRSFSVLLHHPISLYLLVVLARISI